MTLTSSPLASSVPNRIISLSELEKHDEDHDKQWIAVQGFVVDITEYKDEHPGGADILEQQAGKDATQEFYNAGHSPDAERKLLKLAIGRLEESAVKNPVLESQQAESSSGNGMGSWVVLGLTVGVVGALAYMFSKKKQA